MRNIAAAIVDAIRMTTTLYYLYNKSHERLPATRGSDVSARNGPRPSAGPNVRYFEKSLIIGP